jgi:hypothetical protein
VTADLHHKSFSFVFTYYHNNSRKRSKMQLKIAFYSAPPRRGGFLRTAQDGVPATGGDEGLSRTARDESDRHTAAGSAAAPRGCLRSKSLSLFFCREKERKLQREKRAPGAFY